LLCFMIVNSELIQVNIRKFHFCYNQICAVTVNGRRFNEWCALDIFIYRMIYICELAMLSRIFIKKVRLMWLEGEEFLMNYFNWQQTAFDMCCIWWNLMNMIPRFKIYGINKICKLSSNSEREIRMLIKVS